MKRGFLSILLLCWSAICFMGFPASAETEPTIVYFYSSETNINNFKLLKMEFDKYFSRFGSYQFQPFKNRETFEKEVKGKQNCLILLSSWHYANIYKEYSLTPVLVGVREGKKYQKRVLVASRRDSDIESLITGRIASASSVQHTQSTLREMFKDRDSGDSFKILTVPKDIDALMSLGFGMAKSALTTDNSLDKLKMMNPALHKKITILAESPESLLLILAVPGEETDRTEEIVSIIREMPAKPDGNKNMQMLGLDDWQLLDSSDKVKLES